MSQRSDSFETSISTIGWAVFWQGIIRNIALIIMLWLGLSYLNSWVMSAIEKLA